MRHVEAHPSTELLQRVGLGGTRGLHSESDRQMLEEQREDRKTNGKKPCHKTRLLCVFCTDIKVSASSKEQLI